MKKKEGVLDINFLNYIIKVVIIKKCIVSGS